LKATDASSTKESTLVRCPAEISGPISACSSTDRGRGSSDRDFEELHEALVGRRLDEDSRARAAVLAGVVKDRRRCAGGGAL